MKPAPEVSDSGHSLNINRNPKIYCTSNQSIMSQNRELTPSTEISASGCLSIIIGKELFFLIIGFYFF